MDSDWFAQTTYRCRLAWGRRGAADAAARGDVLIVVDTLRFSSAVVTAVRYGARIYPCLDERDAAAVAQRTGAQPAAHAFGSGFSLSPLSYAGVTPGTKVALTALNGATCARYGSAAPYLFAGTLLNAAAAGAAVGRLIAATGLSVTVVPCGERWQTPSEDGEIRFAIEDYLGAGAILAALGPIEKSPEARVCEGAFGAARGALEEILLECGSGRQLVARGRGDDVRHVAQLDLYDVVPILCVDHFVDWRESSPRASGTQSPAQRRVTEDPGDTRN
jgi:2-phosphosulfolactate phosphatase